jgi:hypothetical protein
MAQVHKVDTIQVELKLSELGTSGRVELSTQLTNAAPQSAIYGSNAFVKDAVDKVIQSGADLEAAVAAAQNAEVKLAVAKTTIVTAQAQFDKDLLCLKSAAEAKCGSEEELKELGFNRKPPKAAPAALAAPELIITKMGKVKGSMMIHAKRVGRISTYIAEISPDPIGPGSWQPIPGTGVRRTLTGYQSGAHYWVRFRAVSAKEESAWSEPAIAVAR